MMNDQSFMDAVIAVSPTVSSYSSSDLDTESTGSFFFDKSITLGSLMGLKADMSVPATVVVHGPELQQQRASRPNTRPKRSKSWWRLCRDYEDHVCNSTSTNPSLEHFLEEERRNMEPVRDELYVDIMYDDFTPSRGISNRNLLFAEDRILPPHKVYEQSSGEVSDENVEHGTCCVVSHCFCGRSLFRRPSNVQGNRSVGTRFPTLISGICGGR